MSSADTEIEVDGFGIVPNPDPKQDSYEIVRRYTLTNKKKASIRLITWGAGIQSIRVPNEKGILGDVILGFDNINGYLRSRFIGRTLSYGTSKVFNDFIQRRDDFSSSGKHGYRKLSDFSCQSDNVNWDSCILDKQVVMSHLGCDEDGHCGKSLTQIKYSWTDENELHINVRASTTRPTPIDVTNCCPFNLAGHGMGSNELKNHVITINANEWICMDPQQKRPRRAIDFTERCILDLRNPTVLNSKRLSTIPGGGYNHFFSQNEYDNSCYRFHARVLHPQSGRFLEVFSNQPGLHFQTARDILIHAQKQSQPLSKNCSPNRRHGIGPNSYGKDGTLYEINGAFVISPRNYNIGMNFDLFPSNILYPGHVYHHNMTFKFGVKDAKNKQLE